MGLELRDRFGGLIVQEGERDQFGGRIITPPDAANDATRDRFGGRIVQPVGASVAQAEDETSLGGLAWQEMRAQLLGGARDAVQGIFDAGLWGAEKVLRPVARLVDDEAAFQQALDELRRDAQLPEVERPEGIAGNLVREGVRFALPYSAASRVLAEAGMANAAARGLVGGAAVDFSVYGPHEERLSNLVQEFAPNALTASLAADPDDTEMAGRIKNVAEGGALGVMAEMLAHGISRVAARLGKAPGEKITTEEIRTLAAEGDPDAARIMEAAPGLPRAPRSAPLDVGQRIVVNDPGRPDADLPAGPTHGEHGEIIGLTGDRGTFYRVRLDDGTETTLGTALVRPEEARPATAPDAQPGRYVVEDPVDRDGPEAVRIERAPDGSASVIREDGRAVDVSEMARAGEPPERMVAQAVGQDTSGARVRAAPDDPEAAAARAAEDQRWRDAQDELRPDDDVPVPLSTGEARVMRTAADAVPAVPGARAPSHAGNIRLSRIASEADVRSTLRAIADEYAPGLEDARRGTISRAETRAMARDLGMTEDQLLARRRGQAFNAEEAFAARTLLAESADDLVVAAKAARAGSVAERVAFQQALARHVAVQEQVAGLTAEAGRALAQFRMVASSGRGREAALRRLLDSGMTADPETLARMIDEAAEQSGDLATVMKVARAAWKPSTWDKFMEVWINGLLSGPRTHVINVTSNIVTSFMGNAENALAALIGAARMGENRVFLAEVPARVRGSFEGIWGGLALARDAFLERPNAAGLVKLENRPGAIGGWPGDVVRVPGRLLSAEDAFFKSVATAAELRSLANRRAITRGLRGRARRRFVDELLANPPEDLAEAARSFADYSTFTDALGEKGRAVQQLLRAIPALKLVIPFMKTPTNIIKYAAERTPFGLLMRDVRDRFRAGGATRDIQIARMMVGTGIMAGAAILVDQDMITGSGPSDPARKADLYNTGWQPYSIKIGDTYYSYGRLEPFAMLLGVTADFAQLRQEMGEEESDAIAGLIVGSVSRNLLSKTWLSGLSDMANALTDPARYGERWTTRLAGSLVPAVVAEVERQADPELREARNWIDSIYARVPGLSSRLPYRLNVWGEPVSLEGGLGPDAISPIYVSRDRDDPLMQEVVRLGLGLRMPPRDIMGVEMTPAQYGRFVVMAGRTARVALVQIIQSPGYLRAPDFARAEIIRGVIERSREAARGYTILEDATMPRRIGEARLESMGVAP